MAGALRRVFPSRHRGITLAGVLVIGALALAAALAPWIVPGSPTEIAKDRALRAPTLAEPFGMDDLGRSMLSRVVHAYRVSLGVAIVSVALALAAGVPLGLVAGYAEGVLDQLIMRPLDVLMSFPAILLAIALMSVFGTGVRMATAGTGNKKAPSRGARRGLVSAQSCAGPGFIAGDGCSPTRSRPARPRG